MRLSYKIVSKGLRLAIFEQDYESFANARSGKQIFKICL